MGPEIDLNFQTEVRNLELKFHQMAASHLVMDSVTVSNFGQIDKNLGLTCGAKSSKKVPKINNSDQILEDRREAAITM